MTAAEFQQLASRPNVPDERPTLEDADFPTLLWECLRQNMPTKAGTERRLIAALRRSEVEWITAEECRDWLSGHPYYGTVVGHNDDGSCRYEDRARIKGLVRSSPHASRGYEPWSARPAGRR